MTNDEILAFATALAVANQSPSAAEYAARVLAVYVPITAPVATPVASAYTVPTV